MRNDKDRIEGRKLFRIYYIVCIFILLSNISLIVEFFIRLSMMSNDIDLIKTIVVGICMIGFVFVSIVLICIFKPYVCKHCGMVFKNMEPADLHEESCSYRPESSVELK